MVWEGPPPCFWQNFRLLPENPLSACKPLAERAADFLTGQNSKIRSLCPRRGFPSPGVSGGIGLLSTPYVLRGGLRLGTALPLTFALVPLPSSSVLRGGYAPQPQRLSRRRAHPYYKCERPRPRRGARLTR